MLYDSIYLEYNFDGLVSFFPELHRASSAIKLSSQSIGGRSRVKIDIRLLTETKKDDDETKESLLAVLRLLSIFYVKITHTAYLHTTSIYVH